MVPNRKAEIERKKLKLLVMREEKAKRRREKEQKDVRYLHLNAMLLISLFVCLNLSVLLASKVEDATVRAAGADDDHRKELDAMLSSLGVAPVSGKQFHSVI